MDEEYEDPLAVLLKKAPTKLEFREKQKERRLKLDMLAQNLTQKDSVKSRLGWAVERPSMDCKQGLVSVISLLGHSRHSWTRDPNSVQVHSMFDLSSPNLKSYYDDKVCPPVHDTPMDLYIRSTQLYQSVTQKSPVPSTCTSQEKDLVHSIYPLFKSLLPEIFVPSMP
ncbi:hypothetical protein BC833DRAFT_597271 [Globomyces pollinis-pini]|nr:hypothetical protein BC833DRAFT_597271 [Globomyces pollinis-pini]